MVASKVRCGAVQYGVVCCGWLVGWLVRWWAMDRSYSELWTTPLRRSEWTASDTAPHGTTSPNYARSRHLAGDYALILYEVGDSHWPDGQLFAWLIVRRVETVLLLWDGGPRSMLAGFVPALWPVNPDQLMQYWTDVVHWSKLVSQQVSKWAICQPCVTPRPRWWWWWWWWDLIDDQIRFTKNVELLKHNEFLLRQNTEKDQMPLTLPI